MGKKITVLAGILFIIIIIIPLVIVGGLFSGDKNEIVISVYKHHDQEIVDMELEEYLQGVVAAEMPARYHLEALKAQAVAARTYAAKKMHLYGGSGYDKASGADITTNSQENQAWISSEKLKERWGFVSFFYYWSKINRALEETEGEVLLYNGTLIDAVYHANSGGRTEDAASIWGASLPYLKSVASPYDSYSKESYSRRIEFNVKELFFLLGLKADDFGDFKIDIIKKSSSGRVLQLKAGNRVFSGQDVREKLKLPSTRFSVLKKGDIFIFEIYGKGHGVGMSQDGAQGMAQEGYNYQQILKYYYPGVTIEKLDNIQR